MNPGGNLLQILVLNLLFFRRFKHLYIYMNETSHLANFISVIMNDNFIPSFIAEQYIEVSLHDYESTFHSGSRVRSGMKDGINSMWNVLQLN